MVISHSFEKGSAHSPDGGKHGGKLKPSAEAGRGRAKAAPEALLGQEGSPPRGDDDRVSGGGRGEPRGQCLL